MCSAWLSIHSPQVDQPAQRHDRPGPSDPARALERVDRRQLVGDRADPADARDDVGDLVEAAAAKERFEEAWRLEHVQLDAGDGVVAHSQPQAGLPFDARERADGDASWFSWDSLAFLNGSAHALKLRNTRTSDGGSMPRSAQLAPRARGFDDSFGPKQPKQPRWIRRAERAASGLGHRARGTAARPRPARTCCPSACTPCRRCAPGSRACAR